MSSFPHKKSANTINPLRRSRSSRLLPSRSASQEGPRLDVFALFFFFFFFFFFHATHRRTPATVVEGVLKDNINRRTDLPTAKKRRTETTRTFRRAAEKKSENDDANGDDAEKPKRISKKKRRKPLGRH